MSRTVGDSAAALDATEGPVTGDPYFAPPKLHPYLKEVSTNPGRLKIAFWSYGSQNEPIHEEAVAAVRGAAKLCSELGHEVEEAAPTLNYDEAASAGLKFTVLRRRARLIHRDLKTTHRGAAEPGELRKPDLKFLRDGKTGFRGPVPDGGYNAAAVIPAVYHVVFEKHDIWITPALGCPPLKVGTIDFQSPSASMLDPNILTLAHVNPFYNVTGQPAISLPLHWTSEGLPLGVLFGGKYGDEGTLLQNLPGRLNKPNHGRTGILPSGDRERGAGFYRGLLTN